MKQRMDIDAHREAFGEVRGTALGLAGTWATPLTPVDVRIIAAGSTR